MNYFGTAPNRAGHYWWGEKMKYIGIAGDKNTPLDWGNEEPPIPSKILWDWHLYQINNKTVLCCEGSVYDKRPGSHTQFVEEGIFSLEEMMEKIQKSFPTIWEKIPIKPLINK